MSGEATTAIDAATGELLADDGAFHALCSGEALRDGLHHWRRPLAPGDASLPTRHVPHNAHSALGWLRGWQADRGDQARIPMRCNKLVTLFVTAADPEMITTSDGRVFAQRLDMLAVPVDAQLHPAGGNQVPISLWLTSDERRAPVRIWVWSEYGGIVKLEMVAYDAPPPPSRDHIQRRNR
jgi:hypothetical protein